MARLIRFPERAIHSAFPNSKEGHIQMTQPSALVLRKNDRIVFLGDSITEQQLYTNYVESYLATRFNKLKLTFFNAGWGGDTAPGGVQRLDRDVLALKPTVVTICYGMNDGRYTPPTDEIRTTYVAGMQELIRRLKAAGIRIVLLTPGMVDEAVAPDLGKVHYNDQGLRILVDEVLRLAAQENLPVANLHKLMNDVYARAKAADPKFAMSDGIHPDPAGHLVMAFGLLQALGVPPRHQSIVVDIVKKTVASSPEIRTRRIQKNPYGFSMSLQLDRLPFYVEPAARKVLPFLPFQETFNELKLSVRGLTAGRGYFCSETLRSASIPRQEFDAGVNLFSQWTIKAMLQAETIHRYTLEKDQIYFKAWRNLGLNGGNSSYHNARAHAAGIRMTQALDRSRGMLQQGRPAMTCNLNVVTTDLPGELLRNGDFITEWSLRSPIPKPYDADHLDGEAAFTAQVPKLSVDWCACDIDMANPGMNLIQVFGQQTDCFVYALTLIRSTDAQEAELLIGSDDGVAVWLNGESVLQNLAINRALTVDQERVRVQLRPGDNVLLLKITQGTGAWGMCARLAGLKKPVTAIRP
jgi:lysophospholipase L1-like esterase